MSARFSLSVRRSGPSLAPRSDALGPQPGPVKPNATGAYHSPAYFGRSDVANKGEKFTVILVMTDDAVMLAHKSQSQKIKQMVAKLAEHPRFKKLV